LCVGGFSFLTCSSEFSQFKQDFEAVAYDNHDMTENAISLVQSALKDV
jgi:hypothetical protein